MHLTLASKAARLLLAVSVSVWMAGACLFGCSNTEVLAAEVSPDESSAAVSGESCNKTRQHDCCTRPNAQKPKRQNRKTQKQIAHRQNHTTDGSVLAGVPHRMKDCPLMTNATAVTAKSSSSVPEPGRTPVVLLPAIYQTSEQTQFVIDSFYLPNRGPTYLRCCVFLI